MVVSGQGGQPTQSRWPTLPGRRLVLVVVAVVLAVGLLAVLLAVLRPPRSGGAVTLTDRPAHTAVAPLDGRTRAVFELVTGVSGVRLRAADLGDQLYRISTPTDGGLLPRPETVEDLVRLQLVPSGRGGPGTVEVLLSERVGWQLRITGGAADLDLDLTRGRLVGVELVGGASRIDLRVPRPEGTLAVRMSGGVSQLMVRLPAVLPARIRVAAGAGSVRLYDDRRVGVAPGVELSRADWAAATDRLDLDLVAGAETVTVDRG